MAEKAFELKQRLLLPASTCLIILWLSKRTALYRRVGCKKPDGFAIFMRLIPVDQSHINSHLRHCKQLLFN